MTYGRMQREVGRDLNPGQMEISPAQPLFSVRVRILRKENVKVFHLAGDSSTWDFFSNPTHRFEEVWERKSPAYRFYSPKVSC